jgi:sorbose reductase
MALREIWIRDTPMGRLAEVDDLTGAVIYMASPLSNYMTGHDMIVDGGFTCW